SGRYIADQLGKLDRVAGARQSLGGHALSMALRAGASRVTDFQTDPLPEIGQHRTASPKGRVGVSHA
ncbi:MAG TPA: hypothetical protein VIJ42_16440, partial [Stellaceae bacterium]